MQQGRPRRRRQSAPAKTYKQRGRNSDDVARDERKRCMITVYSPGNDPAP